MCLMDAMTICVLHYDGLIKMMSFDSTDKSRVFKTTWSLRLQGVLDYYHGVVRFKDNLVLSGVKQGTMYWCIVSLDGGHVDTIHPICKGDRWCNVTTKDNIVYISCDPGDKSPDNTGVYGFDILNPSQCKYTYKHQRLQYPTSIVINEDGNIFVCNGLPDNCIHQLTASCQLVAIFTQGIPGLPVAMFWNNGFLYVTRWGSSYITVFQPVYQGSHIASEVLVSDERKQPVIEETAIQIGHENVDNEQSSVETEKPPSGPVPEDAEDEKQGDTKASEVPIIDERKQPVIDATSTQIEQEILIQQSVGETLNQAGIQMSTDLFLRFQREIGTTCYFSKTPQMLIESQESLKATEIFIEQSRPDMKDKWLEYKNQGKLTPELIAVIYSEERNPELYVNKDNILENMKQLNIIVKAKSFDENGLKEENYFFTPCMLHKKSPREVIAPEQDPRMVSTSVLCWVITGEFLPPAIFQNLIAACLARWPVAKKKETSENLIFQDCTVFDLDPIHRLFLHCENHIVFARIAWMGIDDINAKMCTRVRKFITLNLSQIISHLDPDIQYKLCVRNDESQDIRFFLSPPFEMWLVDEVHDPDAPITREHMNHTRLCVALLTVCGNAMRDILLTNVPAPHANIYKAILANKTRLTSRTQIGPGQWQKALLNKDQSKMLFIDPKGRFVAPIDQLDISLLYTLIRNVSTVNPPSTGWGVDPRDNPRDVSLGANVERIRSYRNHICGHSPDGKISQDDFNDYWNKIETVLLNIETVIGQQVFSPELEKQKRQVISVYEDC